MITRELMSTLWCPTCQTSELQPPAGRSEGAPPDDGELRCDACTAAYPVRSGVPVLIPHAALNGREWQIWTDHLEKFRARREARARDPEQAVTRLAGRSQPKFSFAEFTGIEDGTVLDVGCGPGAFRFHLDPDRVDYVGLDPIVLPEVQDFPFVQGVGEYIPFRDGTFTDIVVLAALDHFRDLDRFLHDARRVLRTGGRLHILQSVHELRGPISAIKVVTHKVKDALDERYTVGHGAHVPKHLAEFTRRSLLDRVGAAFDVVATERYSATWYSPDKLFLSFSPKLSDRRPAPSSRERIASP